MLTLDSKTMYLTLSLMWCTCVHAGNVNSSV